MDSYQAGTAGYCHMGCSLNSLKTGYVGDYVGEYYRGYHGGY